MLFFILQRDINGVKNLNWSKFIADELHKALLKRKPTRGCLLFYNVSDDAFLLPSLLSFVIFFVILWLIFVSVYHGACVFLISYCTFMRLIFLDLASNCLMVLFPSMYGQRS